MAQYIRTKKKLFSVLRQDNWEQAVVTKIDSPKEALQLFNALLAMLPRSEIQWQASLYIGNAVSQLAQYDLPIAKNCMRRLMWSLNEESGNIGWGIPQSMGCIIASSLNMAKEYGKILISYSIQTGKGDNYIDYSPLRVGVYWAIGYASVPFTHAFFAKSAYTWLLQSLETEDDECHSMVIWALANILCYHRKILSSTDIALIERSILSRQKEESDQNITITLLEKNHIIRRTRFDIYQTTLALL